MTGLERKSDIVSMASYAPLFVNSNNRAWNPDMIVFDNHRQAQLLFCMTCSSRSCERRSLWQRHSNGWLQLMYCLF